MTLVANPPTVALVSLPASNWLVQSPLANPQPMKYPIALASGLGFQPRVTRLEEAGEFVEAPWSSRKSCARNGDWPNATNTANNQNLNCKTNMQTYQPSRGYA